MAANEERFPGSHQESIATAIALLDDADSQLIANLVDPVLFDSPFDDIVAQCVAHRRKFGKPPGRGHIDDVFAHVFEDKGHASFNQYDTIVSRMVAQADRLDTAYVLAQVSDFVCIRQMRAGIARAVETYQRGGPDVVEQLEDVFRQNLRIRRQERDYGFTLADDRALCFLDRNTSDYCNLRIPALDERGVVPTKREMMAFLAPQNRGKSFFLTHCGKMALLKGWRVLHYTLENSDDMTAQRYFQTLFNGVRREGVHKIVRLGDSDQPDEYEIRLDEVKPAFVLEDRERSATFLRRRVEEWRAKLTNLRIRRFASGRLTFEMLEQDLEELRVACQFEPELLMIDMPQLMKLPRRDRSQQDYAALDQLVTDLRGLAVERNYALVVPQQGTRDSNTARSVQAQHGAGSIGVFGIADNMITYSQTPAEERHGLARLFTQKVRNDRARSTVLISQHYDSGQFCVDSRLMTSRLRERLSEYTGSAEDDEYE